MTDIRKKEKDSKTKKKLEVNKETVKDLSARGPGRVKGGVSKIPNGTRDAAIPIQY